MPYLDCPQCRLTLYSAARHSTEDRCPRCEARLGRKPRSLFGLPPREDRSGAEEPEASVERALLSMGLFRDRVRNSGGRPARPT